MYFLKVSRRFWYPLSVVALLLFPTVVHAQVDKTTGVVHGTAALGSPSKGEGYEISNITYCNAPAREGEKYSCPGSPNDGRVYTCDTVEGRKFCAAAADPAKCPTYLAPPRINVLFNPHADDFLQAKQSIDEEVANMKKRAAASGIDVTLASPLDLLQRNFSPKGFVFLSLSVTPREKAFRFFQELRKDDHIHTDGRTPYWKYEYTQTDEPEGNKLADPTLCGPSAWKKVMEERRSPPHESIRAWFYMQGNELSQVQSEVSSKIGAMESGAAAKIGPVSFSWRETAYDFSRQNDVRVMYDFDLTPKEKADDLINAMKGQMKLERLFGSGK